MLQMYFENQFTVEGKTDKKRTYFDVDNEFGSKFSCERTFRQCSPIFREEM